MLPVEKFSGRCMGLGFIVMIFKDCMLNKYFIGVGTGTEGNLVMSRWAQYCNNTSVDLPQVRGTDAVGQELISGHDLVSWGDGTGETGIWRTMPLVGDGDTCFKFLQIDICTPTHTISAH